MTTPSSKSRSPITSSSHPVVVRRSGIHGRGLFAAREIVAGEWVVEYGGERIRKTESARRQRVRRRSWIFELNRNFDVDGLVRDNPARFINHSCAPNCEVVARDGKLRVRTTRVVVAGEELTFDYGYRLAAFPGHPCACGAPVCAGYIVERGERWRMRRLLGQRGRSLLKMEARR